MDPNTQALMIGTALLDSINQERRAFKRPTLTWSDEWFNIAQEYAYNGTRRLQELDIELDLDIDLDGLFGDDEDEDDDERDHDGDNHDDGDDERDNDRDRDRTDERVYNKELTFAQKMNKTIPSMDHQMYTA